MDNRHGGGFGDPPRYLRSGACPVHGAAARDGGAGTIGGDIPSSSILNSPLP
jgi:hypothetical protein